MIRKIIKFCLFSLWLATQAHSAPKGLLQTSGINYDSSQVQQHHFDQATLQAFRDDPDFQYTVVKTAGLGLWERFWMWVSQLFQGLFYFGTQTPWGKFMVYFFCVMVIGFVILRLLKIDIRKIFNPESKQGALSYEVGDENIHEMDFEQLISDAIEKGSYRTAVRLIYLQCLKILTDHQLISWEPGKTNQDYIYELGTQEIKVTFRDLSNYFAYVWYGDFGVERPQLEEVQLLFKDIRQKLLQP